MPTLTRRRFLGLLAASGSVVAVSGGGVLALRGLAPSVDGLRVLDAVAYRTVARLVEALFPEGGAVPPSGESLALARRFDVFLADEPPWNRADLLDAVWLFEWGPVIFERRLRTFSRLPIGERLATFERWRVSERLVQRQVATVLHKFLNLVYYDRPQVWTHLGYDGPMEKPAPGDD